MAQTLTNRGVVNLINNRLTYKPGWSFSCSDEYSYSSLRVTISWRQLETNPSNIVNDEGEWGDAVSPNSESFNVDVSDFTDEADVMRVVLEHAINLEMRMLVHEAREFFRVKPEMRWDAPFHPHHTLGDESIPEGMNGRDNWRTTSHRALPDNASLPVL